MSTYLHTCDYCDKEYLPTRRGVQRFCKPTCRTMSHRKNKERLMQLSSPTLIQKENSLLSQQLDNTEEKKMKVEEVSMAGVGNSLFGMALYDLGKGILKSGQKEENKTLTKGDLFQAINILAENQKRILEVLEKNNQSFYIDGFSQ